MASDGGIFTFGDAGFYGSTGAVRLAQPIVGMVPTVDGRGYWLVGRDGGIFTFGDAGFVGSLPGIGVSDTIVSVTPTADKRGLPDGRLGGSVYTFGDAPYLGDPARRSRVVRPGDRACSPTSPERGPVGALRGRRPVSRPGRPGRRRPSCGSAPRS